MSKPRPVEKRGGYSGSKVKTTVKVPKSNGASISANKKK